MSCLTVRYDDNKMEKVKLCLSAFGGESGFDKDKFMEETNGISKG